MYGNNNSFTSDLINSYAWDTALVFLQEFDNRDKETAMSYSRQTSVNEDLAEKGTNNTQTPDEICNVYDMASNAKEWTTETEINESEEVDDEYPCVERGTDYCSNRYGECDTSYQNSSTGFRPILYINVDKSQIGEIERTVVIRKYRSGTRTGLQGAEIAIYKDDGSDVLDSDKKLFKLTTDKYGEVAFKLKPGKYKYREEKAPSSYALNRKVYSFEVTQDGMIIFEEENYGIIYDSKLRFRVHVTDRSGNVIPGSRVQLYDSRGNKVEDSNGNPVIGTTDGNGDVYFEDIEPGRYGFGYVEGSDGYTGDGTIYYVDVSEDGTTNYEGNSGGNIYTEEVKGTIKITKYRYGTSIGVQGAIIGIYNEDGSQVLDDNQQPLQLTTGENGEITFTLKPGKYKYKEIKSPRRYALNKIEYTFEVTKDGTVIFGEEKGILYNKKLGFWVHVKDEYGNGIPGSKVQLYDADGNIVTGEDGNPVIGTTDKDGNVFFEDIEPGRHGFGQVESDNGYTVDGTVHYVEIEEDGTVKYEDGSNGDIHTERVSGTIIIWKHRYGTNVGLQGAIIGIYNEDGTPVNQDGKHLTFETNEYGQITFTLNSGKYKYKEEKAPSKYALNSKMYSFEIKEDGTIIFETDGGIIYDTKLRFGVHVKDRVGNGIPDFRVQLYDRNGDIVTDEDGNPVIGTTDENGDVYFEDIESGEYGYGQAEDNNGYIGDEEIHKVEVKEDGTVEYEDGAEGNIYFEVVMSEEGKYKIRKYIKDTTTPVEGAIIALYDEEGNPLKGENGEEIKLTTDVNGEVTIPSLRYGIYKYKEVEAPEGYELNDTMYSFKVNSDGTITFEGETEGIIYNEKIKPDEGEGSGEQKEVIVIIKKYEAGTNIGLEGAVIGIYDENGKAVMREDGTPLKLTTDSNGQIQFKAKPGKYKYREERAPEGYELNATVYTFEVTEDGQVIFGMGTRGIIYNEKIDPDEGKDPDDEQKEIIVIIKKYEKGTNIGLEGAVIGLYYENGDALEDENGRPLKLTTDSNGIIEFKVKPGKYKYREERAPEGYKLNSTIYTFEVTEEGTIIFENDTEGIIYNEKNTDNPKPDDPQDGNRVDDNTVGGNVVVGDNEIGDNIIGDNEVGDNEIGDNTVGNNEVSDNEIGDNTVGNNEITDNEIKDNTTVGNNQTENNQIGDNSNGKPTTGTNKNNAVNSKNSINKIAPNGSTDKKQGSLPYTGIKRGLIVILFVINIICIYFGIKSTKE